MEENQQQEQEQNLDNQQQEQAKTYTQEELDKIIQEKANAIAGKVRAEEKKKLAELESWQSYDLMLWFRYFWKGEIKNVKQSIIFDGFYCKE